MRSAARCYNNVSMQNKKRRRTGPLMSAARDYVAAHLGCSKLEVARAIRPRDTYNQIAYSAIDRAIRSGLIAVAGRRGNAYQLVIGGAS